LGTASQPSLAGAKKSRGQSYVELALVIPVLLIMLLGLVEVSFYIANYLNTLDLTREAARFASLRDPFTLASLDTADCLITDDPNNFNFYYMTACIFSQPPPPKLSDCTYPKFCNGLNTYQPFNSATDDIVISVFTVSNVQHDGSTTSPSVVTDHFPSGKGYWSYSEDKGGKPAGQGNWATDCSGHIVSNPLPYYTAARVNIAMNSGSVQTKGFVAVEYYYCYKQVLGLPLLTNFIPNPLRVHVYTLMPNPAAQPTDTPPAP
jgi:hypothetical protein